MALSDPQDVIINSITTSLPRISSGNNSSVYQSNDGLIRYILSHQYNAKRVRHLVRLEHAKIAADPFQSTLNARYNMSAHLVVDSPIVGYTVAEQKYVVDALAAELTASSGALVTKIIGGES